MNIVEAIEAGRNFKRKNWTHYFPAANCNYSLSRDDLLAEDWEVEEIPIKLTREQFYDAVTKVSRDSDGAFHVADLLAKELGL